MADLRGVTNGYHGSGSRAYAAFPTPLQAGDLLVLLVGDRYTPTISSAWTVESALAGTNQSGLFAWKIADASDVSAAQVYYDLSGTSTGTWAVLAFKAGTFNVLDPVLSFWTNADPTADQATNYLAISTGQDIYHFITARTGGPAQIFASNGGPLFLRAGDPDNAAALFTQEAASETTLNETWSSAASVTGAFKASFIVNDPAGSSYLGAINGSAVVLRATYDVAAIGPDPKSYLLTRTPVLRVLADGTPKPFQVEFQTSASLDFSSPNVTWDVVLTGINPGEVDTQVGINLPDGKTSYWRARAGDGTTWGPWSVPSALQIYLARSSATEYFEENVGALLGPLSSLGIESLYENAGIAALSSPVAVESLYENAGFERIAHDDTAEYIYESEVSTNTPTPHLWFVYKTYGFVNDHVYLYGQGLGSLASQYNAKPMIDYGPDFTLDDIALGIFDWSVLPGGPDSYGPDRKIYAGADGAPPTSNVETQIIEVVIPTDVAPSQDAGSQLDQVYVKTDGGSSNQVGWLVYPSLPIPMTTTPSLNRTGVVARVVADPVASENLIEQLHAAFTADTYMVAGSDPVAMPAMGAFSLTEASVLTYSTTSSLQAPLEVNLGATRRWLPDESKFVPRTDLGTGVSTWLASVGDANTYWKMTSPQAPYVNPAYLYDSRLGDQSGQGVIFDGTSWLELSAPVADGPVFSIAFVGVLHPNPSGPESVIMSTFVSGTPAAGTYPLKLSLAGDLLQLKIGGRMSSDRITQLSARPVAVVYSSNATTGRLLVLDKVSGMHSFTHPTMETSGMKIYLGRPGTFDLNDRNARMDLLDLAMWNNTALSAAQMWSVASKLDSVYGVTGPNKVA